MTSKKRKTTDDSIKEWAGNTLNGNPTFQGFAYGYGGRNQLAQPVDSQVPEDFEEIVKSIVEDELLKGLYERHPADQFYNDLPGTPGGMTNLSAKKQFVPIDPEEANNAPVLGPTVGGFPVELNTPNDPNATTRSSLGRQIIDMDALVVDYLPEDYLPEESVGIWSSFGRDQLVAPRDWQKELEAQQAGDITAKLPLGGMGNVSSPKTHVPNSISTTNVMLKNMMEKVININEGSEIMKIDGIYALINEIIFSEMAKNFGNFVGSEELLSQASTEFGNILQKYGGDYKKAEQSQEWQNQLKSFQIKSDKESSSYDSELLAKRVGAILPQKEPLLAPFQTRKKQTMPGGSTATAGGPVGTTGTGQKKEPTAAMKFTNRLKNVVDKKGQFADTQPAIGSASKTTSSPAQGATTAPSTTGPQVFKKPQGYNPPLANQSKKNVSEGRKGNEKTMSKLEETITALVRKAIREELRETVALLESSFKQRLANLEAKDGEVVIVDEEEFVFDAETDKWWHVKDYEQMTNHREAEWNKNNPEPDMATSDMVTAATNTANKADDGNTDLVTKLMEMEFETTNGKSSVSEEVLESLVKESVKRFLFEGE